MTARHPKSHFLSVFLSVQWAGVLAASGCSVGDVYSADSRLAYASGNPGLGMLLGAAGDSMTRQEDMQHDIAVAQAGRSQVVMINGQAYTPVSANQAAYSPRPRLPGAVEELIYINLCSGSRDINGDGMIGDNELIRAGRAFRQNERFEVVAKYAGRQEFSLMNLAIKNEKLKWALFGWTKQTGPVAIPYGNYMVRVITVNPGDLKPGNYGVIRLDALGTPKLLDFQITP